MERTVVEGPNQQDNREPEEETGAEDDPSDVVYQKTWEPTIYCNINKETHYYAGHEIRIYEALDSYGAIIWPAGLALCQYLDSNQGTVTLRDKAVLELGAGTGLVSIVACLLGAWVTATDLPEVLGNLRCNLCRNTRGRCRYTPQVATLSWDSDLEQTFPRTIYRYDYVLAADVVYHHDFLDELLVTMRHFCQPGTTLIWANKIRFASDLVFTENFTKTFNTTLLVDMGEIKIYSATMNDVEVGLNFPVMVLQDTRKHGKETEEHNVGDVRKEQNQHPNEEELEEMDRDTKQRNDNQTGEEPEDNFEVNYKTAQDEELESDEQLPCPSIWESKYSIPGKEIHYFMGRKIVIEESFDSYGAMIWPAAVALCKFLETPDGRQQINLLDKTVLEIGAGTGLLSVVITLLGGKLTATDLPEILSNLRYNLNRNTRWLRRHEPEVKELSWGYDLEKTFPRSLHHYDYVLAADVVYHHDCLDELLATMHHFCQPETTVIWANKIRYPSDLTFLQNFENIFRTTLLTELGDIRIYSATYKAL